MLISCGWDLAIIQFFKSYIMYDSRVVTFCYIVHLKTTSQTYKINQNCRLCSKFFLFGKLYILDFFRYTACIICKHKIEEWCYVHRINRSHKNSGNNQIWMISHLSDTLLFNITLLVHVIFTENRAWRNLWFDLKFSSSFYVKVMQWWKSKSRSKVRNNLH